MNPQLETLILLQDLDLMIREMSDKTTAKQMTRIGFEIEAVDSLIQAREDLARKVNPELLASYGRLMERGSRAVVPVRKGVCLACFIKLPTRYSGGDEKLLLCHNCHRFLYFI